MLQILIPTMDQWDEYNQVFVQTKQQELCLEHSLVSISKWESKWCKPFLSNQQKTIEETVDYVKCMTITQNVSRGCYDNLTQQNMVDINRYIEASMTATTFYTEQAKGHRETITSELIYYWMIALNIPMECQRWHLNRLLTLIKVCNIKNQPPKKRSKQEIMSSNAALNASRRKQLQTKG